MMHILLIFQASDCNCYAALQKMIFGSQRTLQNGNSE